MEQVLEVTRLRRASALAVLTLALLVGGCATKTLSPDVAPEYVVIKDFAKFYRLGPQQGGGPDASLRNGDPVKLLRNEMGFSFIQIEDGRTGYTANENIVPAPPGGVRKPEPPAPKKKSPRPKADSDEMQTSGAEPPLPEPAPPTPDMNAEPGFVPEPPPPAAEEPATPKFRY